MRFGEDAVNVDWLLRAGEKHEACSKVEGFAYEQWIFFFGRDQVFEFCLIHIYLKLNKSNWSKFNA